MRLPKPWLRKQNQTWYVQINGKQHNLGKDREQAFAKYHQLMHLGTPTGSHTVREVLDAYWQWAQANLAERTCETRKGLLRDFGKFVPASMKAAELRPFHLTSWIEGRAGIKSPTTVNDYITILKSVFKWAVAMGYLDTNPVANVPKPRRRMRQDFLPADTWRRVLEEANDQEFKDYLLVMFSSGARAQEMHKFEAQHFDGKRLVLPIEDSKGQRSSRIVYLPPEALEVVQRLAEKHPEGKLFRNSEGRPWNRNSIGGRFRRLRKRLKLPSLTATTLRHSFAHYRLSEGQDALTVAKLMGHVDTRMVATRYGHLDANTEYMQQAADQVTFPATGITADGTTA